MSKVSEFKLLVEGKSEERFIPYLIALAGIPWGPKGNEIVKIEEFKGRANLLESGVISAELKVPGAKAVGVVIDADLDAEVTYRAVWDRVQEVLPNFPKQMSDEGAFVPRRGSLPAVGVWVMPDNQASGELESLVLTALRSSHPKLTAYAERCTADSANQGGQVPATKEDKAVVHSILAWLNPPGRQLHDAARDGVFSAGVAPASEFVTWFKKLFAEAL
jgi:hypothetical protein